MSKPKGWIIGQWAGVGVSVALAGIGVVALRHALETPQPLKSVLPGEAHLYRWQKRSIFYKVAGAIDAPPLVLLHTPDIGGSGHEMQSIMSPLAETYRVYTLDLLGFGISDRPGIEYSAKLYSTLCKDFLREVVQRPATLVASGLSCNYAVTTAAEVPDLCASLVLISPTALQGETQASQLRQLAEKQPVKALLYPLLSTRLAFLLTNWLKRANREDFAQFYANTHQLGAEHAAMALLAGKLTESAEGAFETLCQPILMMWGTHALDNHAIVANLHRTTTLLNPEHTPRKVELIQEATLAVHQERPEGVITALRRWQEEMLPGMLQQSTVKATAMLAATSVSQTTPVRLPDRNVPASGEMLTSAPVAFTESGENTRSSTPPPKPVATSEQVSLDMVTQEIREASEPEPATLDEPAGTQGIETPGDSALDSVHQEIMAYCVKCKQKRAMLQVHKVIMKNGRPATRGICPICGTRLNRIGEIN